MANKPVAGRTNKRQKKARPTNRLEGTPDRGQAPAPERGRPVKTGRVPALPWKPMAPQHGAPRENAPLTFGSTPPKGCAKRGKSGRTSKPGHSPADHSAANVGGSLPACWRHAGGMLAACRRHAGGKALHLASGNARFVHRNACFAARGPWRAQQTPSFAPSLVDVRHLQSARDPSSESPVRQRKCVRCWRQMAVCWRQTMVCWRHAGGMLAACRRQSPVFAGGKAHFARRDVCFAARGPRHAQQTPSFESSLVDNRHQQDARDSSSESLLPQRERVR